MDRDKAPGPDGPEAEHRDSLDHPVSVGSAPDGGQGPTAGAARRRRRTVALATAAVLVLGGGGAWLASGSPGPDRQSAAGAGAPGVSVVPSGGSPSGGAGRAPKGPGGGSATGPIASPAPGNAPAARSYTQDGRRLTVWFWSGVCEKFGLRADESAPGRVAVRVVVTEPVPKGEACVMMAKYNSVSVQLDQPLGGRAVVDSVTGKALPLRGPHRVLPMPGGSVEPGPR